MPPLSYDIIMATRNRPEAVALSLPLILAQSRLPAEVVIVDSSDDPAPIRALAEEAAARNIVPVRYTHSGPGLTHQRNVGLGMTGSPIVIFPDDDSLMYLDCADHILAAYEADTDHTIAGVCARPVDHAPPETTGDLGAYQAETTSTVKTAIAALRQALKDALGFTNPFVATGRKLNAQYRLPGWAAHQNVVRVPYMTGFRMSYRRAAIQGPGFDETLQRYGWYEDIDASCTALRQGQTVGALNARIYHHRVAAARANGYTMGLWAVLNRTYVVTKHIRANPGVFRSPSLHIARLKAYCRARALVYRLTARDQFARDRARGAADGLARMDQLTRAAPGDLAAAYTRLTAEAA